MKKCMRILLLLTLVVPCFAPDTLEQQLLQLRSALQQLIKQLPVQEVSPIITKLTSKIDQFIQRIRSAKKPRILSSLLLEQLGIVSSKVPKVDALERTPEEMQEHQELRADFSDLIQEIDHTKESETLRNRIIQKIEELYEKLPPEEPQETTEDSTAIQDKITLLIKTINESSVPTEFFRIVLEKLQELPTLPERENGLELDPQEEKNILEQFAQLTKEIIALKNFVQARSHFVQQLKTAYSQAIAQAKEEEKTEIDEEEIIIIPEVPREEEPKKEKTAEELEQEEYQKTIKEVLEERRKAIEGEYEGEQEEEDEDLEYFPWD